jgi:hypothetical protein
MNWSSRWQSIYRQKWIVNTEVGTEFIVQGTTIGDFVPPKRQAYRDEITFQAGAIEPVNHNQILCAASKFARGGLL